MAGMMTLTLAMVLVLVTPINLRAQETVTPAGNTPAQAVTVVRHVLPTCPVMDGVPIDAEAHEVVIMDGGVEHHIFVCCGQCERAVKANPQKYLAKVQAMEAGKK